MQLGRAGLPEFGTKTENIAWMLPWAEKKYSVGLLSVLGCRIIVVLHTVWIQYPGSCLWGEREARKSKQKESAQSTEYKYIDVHFSVRTTRVNWYFTSEGNIANSFLVDIPGFTVVASETAQYQADLADISGPNQAESSRVKSSQVGYCPTSITP